MDKTKIKEEVKKIDVCMHLQIITCIYGLKKK